MNRKYLAILIIVIFAGLFLAGRIYSQRQSGLSARIVTTDRASQPTPDIAGFQRALAPKPIEFPKDFGPHPDFQTEWWYYTGNLETQDGRHFGYQLTFFRRALLPPDEMPVRMSDWATRQVYMAHFALTDVSAEKHQAVERLSRGAAGLAGAQNEPFQVWLEDWQVRAQGQDSYQIQAQAEGPDGLPFAINLNLIDLKGPVLQGDRGYSRKGAEPGQASYYFSQTRLQSSGTVQSGSQFFEVQGYSWMDHEYSTSALAAEQIGWDWFAIQFTSAEAGEAAELYEIMVFQIRRADGSIDPYSSGTLINPGGSTRSLNQDQIAIEVLDHFQSPHSGASYPSSWSIQIPEAGLNLNLAPYLADQELNVSYAYWEGAVKISGTIHGVPVNGSGYVELTGYSGSMGGEF
jgi:predicted secreted hydrolase